MDRARSSHFVWQLPRTSLELVHEQEQVEDKQVLLNETWPHYCDRFPGPREAERNQPRQKWVTETWEEYESRIPKREANIHRFFKRQAIQEDAAQAEVARLEAIAERNLAEIKRREHRRRARFLPTLHTLLYDPFRERDLKHFQEQAERMKQERSVRRNVEEAQFREWCFILSDECSQREWLIEDLERRRLEEEERMRKEAEEERRRQEAEEEARRLQEEEERRLQQEELNRQKEEALRKRKELEERRKAEQLRMKEERERQRKAEEEAEALRRQLMEEEQRRKEEAAAKAASEWAANRDAQSSWANDFLEALKAKVDEAVDMTALGHIMAWAMKEMGLHMSSFAFYIGLLDGGDQLLYKYASDSCTPKLKSGTCHLSVNDDGRCPTIMTILGRCTEVYVSNINSRHDIIHLGDGPLLGPGKKEGDFFGLPLITNQAHGVRCIGVLSADTLTSNGEREAWDASHPEPGPCARPMDDDEKQFLRDVAKILSLGLSAMPAERPGTVEPEAIVTEDLVDYGAALAALEGTDSSIGKILGTGLEAIAKLLNNKDLNAYIAMPDRSHTSLAVVYQLAGGKVFSARDKRPTEEALGRHSFLIGKRLPRSPQSMSFGLLDGESSRYAYCPDVSQSDNAALYGGTGTKQEDCLLVATVPHSDSPKPFAMLGVETSANPGLSQAQIDAILDIAQTLSHLIGPMRTKTQTSGICKQVIQWLQATTGVKNVYISVPHPEGLRYIAASKGNEPLVGKILPAAEGVSHGVWEAEDGEVFIEDLKADAENNGGVKFWFEEHKGQPGQCLFMAVKGEDGEPLAVLGCDTLGGGKNALCAEDLKVFRKSAAVLASIFDEIAQGTLDDLNDEISLQIEQLVGAGGVRFYKKILLDVLVQLAGLTKDQLLEMARYSSPPELVVKVVSATLIVLQNKPRLVKEWDACRRHIKQPLIDKMNHFDATKEGKKRKNFFRRAKFMLKGLDMETVFSKGSLPASLFFQWSYVSVQLRYVADLLRRQAQAGILDLGDDEDEDDDAKDEDMTEDGDGDDDGDAGGAEAAGDE